MTKEEALTRIKERDFWDRLNQKEKEALQTLIPELAESEDERIRRTLVEYFGPKVQLDLVRGVPIQKIRDWLEKQKEQTEDLSTRLNGLMQEYVKSGKDEEEQEHRLKCYQLFWDALGDSEFFKQKEQKVDIDKLRRDIYQSGYNDGYQHGKEDAQKEQEPIEPSDDELQKHQDELYDFKVFATKQAKEYHISFVHDFEWNNFCAELLSYFNEKQKPAEWSEEDEENFGKLHRLLVICQGEKKFISSDDYDKLDNWLKSLRPKSKQEWREEDERMRRTAIEACKTVAEDSIIQIRKK